MSSAAAAHAPSMREATKAYLVGRLLRAQMNLEGLKRSPVGHPALRGMRKTLIEFADQNVAFWEWQLEFSYPGALAQLREKEGDTGVR